MGGRTMERPSSFVFRRRLGAEVPTVDRAQGAVVWDRSGKRYLDGSGGAVVVNIGHGRREVAEAIAAQAAAAAYVHGTHFTSAVLEEYARRRGFYGTYADVAGEEWARDWAQATALIDTVLGDEGAREDALERSRSLDARVHAFRDGENTVRVYRAILSGLGRVEKGRG